MRISSGKPFPLGATWDGQGVNFALFSGNATFVELSLFDGPGTNTVERRIAITQKTDGIWHVYLSDVGPGQLYGYRVHGPYEPGSGHRFNAAKLLLDPFARAITGTIRWNDALCDYANCRWIDQETRPDPRDSAPFVPRCMVVDTTFDWEQDQPPKTAWNRTVIYECHVRGMTQQHPEIPSHLRGTYLGLASKPIVEHLQRIGITALELLPVQHSFTEYQLFKRGLTNYWGYNTIGYFAPDSRYATGAFGEQVNEFKCMVRALHKAGIEVILDVVYNHTGEGDHLGPTLFLRGIDNASYYRLDPADRSRYINYAGCGNILDSGHAQSLRLITDSLRYWVHEMHVDGFRFDLAPVLTRKLEGDVETFSDDLFNAIAQDPLLSRVKLIAEPWDLGPGGYRLGAFPTGWSEWNDTYRDRVRRFWRGDPCTVGPLASALSGSSELFEKSGRPPQSGINFITAHDGFTLNDLVSYETKHNKANGEDNRDGTNDNLSKNWGEEGASQKPTVIRIRARMMRNFLATLVFSHGVPMLSHGDELGRTQEGNNNAYCQDNPLTWINWELSPVERKLISFTRKVIKVRQQLAALRSQWFFIGKPVSQEEGEKDLTWLYPDGSEYDENKWTDPQSRTLGMLIHGAVGDEIDDSKERIDARALLLLINGSACQKEFLLPKMVLAGKWCMMVNTAQDRALSIQQDRVSISAHSLKLLCYKV